MTKDAQLKQRRLRKLDPRAHVGYLVGYNSTNIFRAWIPHQGKVISTRDVIFDEASPVSAGSPAKSHLLRRKKLPVCNASDEPPPPIKFDI
jgi:hypothetical protein